MSPVVVFIVGAIGVLMVIAVSAPAWHACGVVVATVPHSRRARSCRARACYSNCCDHCGDRRGYGQRCSMAIVVVVAAVSRSP